MPSARLSVPIGAVLLLAALWRAARFYRANHLPILMVLGFAFIFITMLITKINFVTSLYPLQAVPALVLAGAFGLYAMRMSPAAAPAGPERAAPAAADCSPSCWPPARSGRAAFSLLQYPTLVTHLTPENRALGDWLDHCAAADARILAAAYIYVPPRIITIGW